MTKNNFENFDLGKLNLDNYTLRLPEISKPFYETEGFKKMEEETQENLAAAHLKKEQYEQDVLNTLRQIEGNTANLTTLVNLIQTSNDNQGEILEVITELLALAKEKDPEVVDSKYRKIMNKITTFTEDVNTMTTLMGFGAIVLNILKAGA